MTPEPSLRTTVLHELISQATAPEEPALIGDDGTTITFAELERQTRCVAAWITHRTIPGDRIAVVADNSTGYAALYYGVPRSGRVLTLINQRLAPAEQAAQLAATRPTVLFGDARYLSALPAASAQHVVAFDSADWQTALSGDPHFIDVAQPEDPAWLLFTSGSTGVPKGVVHSHRSLLAAVRGTVEGRSVEPGGVYLLPFPMCHIAGYNLLVNHSTGSTVVLTAQFRPETFADMVTRHQVRSCSLAPTMLHALLGYLERSGRSLPTLRSVAYGSAAMPLDLLRRAIDTMGVDFHQGYGMTETGGNVTFLGPAEHRAGAAGDADLLASAGYPHREVEVAIVDPAGHRLPPTGVGEIVIRGAQVAPGYWPDGIGVSGGWLATGDVGRMDRDGRLYVVDRLKDIIVTGGENVSSREVEDVLSLHPDVDMVAVVGVPDDYWGEAVCAVVVPVAGRQPTEADLVAHVRSAIAGFKRPRAVLLVEELPLTGNGKVAKAQVRAYARSALGRDNINAETPPPTC
ncbi:AMP-binding protein [Mycobacterium aquaticum]|uniref:AMP-binding protein n=1 Tax=Mycobacterium aquaticum TaxID=1927124 RepID=UPI001FE9BA80|nr:AMP-binding protein [Mycobacterium aquaticum]